MFTTGGGGYGDPLERPRAAVVADVKGGRISSRAAEDLYGVVAIDEAGGADATARRRNEMRAGRNIAEWMFDRGEDYTRRRGQPRYQVLGIREGILAYELANDKG